MHFVVLDILSVVLDILKSGQLPHFRIFLIPQKSFCTWISIPYFSAYKPRAYLSS